MTEAARATGAAYDATVTVVDNIHDLEEAARESELRLAEARAAIKAARPALAVARLTDKVARFRAHLQEAERELAEAVAAAKGN